MRTSWKLRRWFVVLSALLLAAASSAAQAVCRISNSAPAILEVGAQGFVESRLDIATSTVGPRDVEVRFEIVQGNADFAGSPSPVTRPVTIARGATTAQTGLNVVPRGPGPVRIRVTWLDAPGSSLLLHCLDEAAENNPALLDIQAPAPAFPLDSVYTVVSGNGQSVRVGNDSAPLVVELKSASFTPLAGRQIRFSASPATAVLLSAPLVTTDAQGRAQVSAKGLQPGPVTVTASVVEANGDPRFSASFALNVVPRLANARVTVVSGDNQALALNTLSAPLVVEVRDADNQPLAGVRVAYRTEPPGAGSFECGECITDAAGRTQNRVRATQAGAFAVIATLADAPEISARFSLSAGGVPAGSQLTIVSGNNQNLVPGAPSAPLVVQLRDPAGAALPGVRIRFVVEPMGNAVFNPPEVLTDAQGQASTRIAPQLPGGFDAIAAVANDPRIQVTFRFNGGTAFIGGLNPNQQGIGRAIDAACPQLAGMPPGNLGPGPSDFLQRCSELVGAAAQRPGDVQAAFDQLLPDEAQPQATVSLSVRDAQLRNIDLRLDTLRLGARGFSLSGLQLAGSNGTLPLSLLGDLAAQLAADDAAEDIPAEGLVSPWGAFLTGTIGRNDKDAVAGSGGFDGDTLSLTGGVDYRFSPNWVAGLALGYDDNDVSFDADRGGIDLRSLTLSLYGAWTHDSNFYVDGRIAYGDLDFELERRIRYNLGANPVDAIAAAAPGGSNRLLALSLGRSFARNAWSFDGYLRGEVSSVELDGYTETIRDQSRNGRGLAVRIDARELDSRTATLGARLGYASSRDWGVLLPYGRVEWVREFETDPQTIVARFVNDPSGSVISIPGDEVDDGYGNVAFGLTAVLANGRSAFLQYERRFGQDDFDKDQLSLGGRVEF